MKTKMCSSCRRVLSTDEFHKNRNIFDGFDPKCKVCKRDYQRAWRELKRAKYISGELKVWSKKRCGGCKRLLSLDSFYKNSKAKDGRMYWCRTCADESNRAAKAVIREEFLSGERVSWKEKRCASCKEIKAAKEFGIDRSSKSGLTTACKKCIIDRKKALSAATEKANNKTFNI